jgi:hypothetical protein
MTSVIILALQLAAAAPVQQSTTTPAASGEAALIQALISEIRELRLSLERSNLMTLRFQAAMQATQLHSERMKELSGQLNLVKIQLSGTAGRQTGLAGEIKRLERDQNSSNPTTRLEAEQRLTGLKAELERANRELSDLTVRESALLSDIQRETVQMEDWQRWLQQFQQPPPAR